MAEDPARELPNLSRGRPEARSTLYADEDSPKYEKAALRRLEQYLTEGSPRLQQIAEVAASVAKLELDDALA